MKGNKRMKNHILLTNMETILQSGIVKKKQRRNQETCLGICQQYKGHYKITTETLLKIIMIIIIIITIVDIACPFDTRVQDEERENFRKE